MRKIFDNKHIYVPFLLLLFLFVSYLVSDCFFDNDGYWIIASGKYIVENGIPKTNPFTFVKDLEIIIQQWPWAIYCYKIYSSFGNIGIYISSMLFFLLNLIVFYRLARLKDSHAKITTTFAILIFLTCYVFISIRPTMITVLLLGLEVYILEYYRKTNKSWILLFLVLISFLEINLHSAIWFLHFVFMLPYLVPPIKNPFVLFKEDNIRRKPLFLILIPMTLVSLLNPYGLKGILYIVYSFGDKLDSANISELGCWGLKSFYGLLIIASLIILAIICTKNKYHEKRIDAATFYLFCGTAIMGILYIRNLVYFCFGCIILFIELIKDVNFEKVNTWIEHQIKYTCLYVWVIVVLFICLFYKDWSKTITTDAAEINTVPAKIVEYLDEKNVDKSTRIYTEFNTGGYFEFKGYHCFIDARPELYFKELNKKDDVFADYTAITSTSSKKKIKKILEKYDFEYLCVSKDELLDAYLKSDSDYKYIMSDKNSKTHLYQKK